jgi:hypothetical protein
MSDDFTFECATCLVSLKGNLPPFLYENINTDYPEVPKMFKDMVVEKIGRSLTVEESIFVESTLTVFDKYPGQVFMSILEQFMFWIIKDPEKIG